MNICSSLSEVLFFSITLEGSYICCITMNIEDDYWSLNDPVYIQYNALINIIHTLG